MDNPEGEDEAPEPASGVPVTAGAGHFHGAQVVSFKRAPTDCYRYRAIPSPVNQRWQQFDPRDTANCFFVTRAEHRLMNTNWQDRPEFAGMMKSVCGSLFALAT